MSQPAGTTRDAALELDRQDDLKNYREQFHVPRDGDGHEVVYLCGNSLGLQPRSASEFVLQELKDWRELGVEGHFHGRRPWLPYHERLAAPMAELVGAQPLEVVCMNTLTVNLHLMMVSFYRPTTTRFKILIERKAFPSDRYAVESQIRFHGFDPEKALVEIAPRAGESTLRTDDLLLTIDDLGDSLALVMLPGVQYFTGQVFDIPALTAAARDTGAAVGWDLAHAVGNVPLQLHDWDVDFAVWCTYKYLNAGPGAIAGCFVHQRHAENPSLPRFAGWWGHDKATRFRMGPEFAPLPGAEGWQLSNPPILAMAPVLASLEIFRNAGMDALRNKSVRLTGFLADCLANRLADRVEILTPPETEQRGCQLSLRLRGGSGRDAFDALTRRGVICDWREPDGIRVAPVPLYNQFVDTWRFADILADIVSS